MYSHHHTDRYRREDDAHARSQALLPVSSANADPPPFLPPTISPVNMDEYGSRKTREHLSPSITGWAGRGWAGGGGQVST